MSKFSDRLFKVASKFEQKLAQIALTPQSMMPASPMADADVSGYFADWIEANFKTADINKIANAINQAMANKDIEMEKLNVSLLVVKENLQVTALVNGKQDNDAAAIAKKAVMDKKPDLSKYPGGKYDNWIKYPK